MALCTNDLSKDLIPQALFLAKCEMNLCMRNKVTFCFTSEKKSVLLTAKANKVTKCNRITHVQSSVFCRHNFA